MSNHSLCVPQIYPLSHWIIKHLFINIISLSVAFTFHGFIHLWQLSNRFTLTVFFGRFQVNYRVQTKGKAKRLSSCKRKGCPSVEVGLKLQRRTSDVGRASNPGMANKENELTCSDDVRGMLFNDNCGLPVNSAEASKMAEASSKYSNLTEVRS